MLISLQLRAEPELTYRQLIAFAMLYFFPKIQVSI